METNNLAQQLIAECRATKSKKLDLGYCGLREIPAAVFELTHLEELYLCNTYWGYEQRKWVHSENRGKATLNKLSILPEGLKNLQSLKILFTGGGLYIWWNISDISALQNLTQLNHLDLSYNKQIKDFSFIQNLTQLNHLNLRSNNIQDISCIQNLTQLNHLVLSYNNIQDISFIQNLTQLNHLDLRSNNIQDISFIQNLTQLNYLDLNYNKQIKDFSFIQNLTQLNYLGLSYNNIQDISFIQNLTQLNHLNLSSNKQIKDFSFIQNLTQLNYLNLSSNKQIKDFSFIQNLTQLNYLGLRSNNIQDISCIQNLTQLNHLDLSENQIQDISFIQNLTQLNHLELSSNQIQDISFIQNLTQLNHLNLNYNQIQDISCIQNLTQLNLLELSSNNIQDISILPYLPKLKQAHLQNNVIQHIPLALLKHPTLEYLNVRNNQLNHIPDEILEGISLNGSNNALPDLQQWYADLAKGSIPNYYFKLLILGNGRVGKSCIVDALQGRAFDPNKKSSHAIILEKWPKKTPTTPDTPQYFIWDFGGQEIYHSTHKWFMRSRAVYLVVWDRASEQAARITDPLTGIEYDNHTIPYWINTIRANNPDIPILLVENKLDKYEHKPLRLSDKELPQKYRADIELSRFSAAERKNYLRRLESDILMLTESMDEYGQEMPLSWHKVRERVLACIFNDQHKATLQKLSKKEFDEWCAAAEVLPKSAPALLRFLHRTGVVYTDDKLLGDTILIDQQWAIDAIYKVMERGTRFFKDVNRGKGRFAQYSLFDEWLNNRTHDYTASDCQLFLKFMLSCKLCFQINDTNKDLGDDNEYAIPQLMPEIPPANVTAIWQADLPNMHYLEFQYDFLHYATVQDFIVAMGRKTNLEFIWKNGISIPHQESQALVTAAVPEKIIHIRTMGAHRAFLLSAIRNAFRAQIDKDLAPTVRVSNDGLHFVDLAELQKCQAADNTNVEVVHKKSSAKSYQAAALYAWALQWDDKADLKKLPDVVQVPTPVVTEKTAPSPTPPSNPFIASPNVTDKGDTIKIELPKSMFTIQTPQLDNIEKVVTQSYEINKAHFALSQRSRDYIESIFERVKIADAQLFDSALKQREFYKKAETYFQQLSPTEQQAFPAGWQNADSKHKLKAVLNLGFIKYERELEVKGFELPRTWEAFKGVFYN